MCVLHCRYHEFEPTDVGVVVLPNGQRAVTYTRQSQTGHGDHREANVEIDKIIRKTKHLQVPSRVCVYVCVCAVVKVVMCSRGEGSASEVETHKNIDSVLHTKTTFQAHSIFSVSIQK